MCKALPIRALIEPLEPRRLLARRARDALQPAGPARRVRAARRQHRRAQQQPRRLPRRGRPECPGGRHRRLLLHHPPPVAAARGPRPSTGPPPRPQRPLRRPGGRRRRRPSCPTTRSPSRSARRTRPTTAEATVRRPATPSSRLAAAASSPSRPPPATPVAPRPASVTVAYTLGGTATPQVAAGAATRHQPAGLHRPTDRQDGRRAAELDGAPAVLPTAGQPGRGGRVGDGRRCSRGRIMSSPAAGWTTRASTSPTTRRWSRVSADGADGQAGRARH